MSGRGYRWLLGALALALLVVFGGCANLPSRAADRAVVADDQLIALVATEAERDSVIASAARHGLPFIGARPLDGLDLIMVSFRLPDGFAGKTAIDLLEGDVPGATVGINHAYRAEAVATGAEALDFANALVAWPEGRCTAQVPVGIIDTAVDRAALGQGLSALERARFSDLPPVAMRHGSEVAAVLTDPRRLKGVRLHAADVFGQSTGGEPLAGADGIVRALDWMAAQDVRLVNMSLTGPFNKLVDLAVRQATARGILVVAAVGNAGPGSPPLYPAGFESVIAVTAVDADQRIYASAVRGGHVDVAAPGVDVLVQLDGASRFVTGTSIATPFVTARIAADPALAGIGQADQALSAIGTATRDLGPAGRDTTFGAGLIQADAICP